MNGTTLRLDGSLVNDGILSDVQRRGSINEQSIAFSETTVSFISFLFLRLRTDVSLVSGVEMTLAIYSSCLQLPCRRT